MDLLLQLFVNGMINGSHYALLGIGFGLIFATTRIVHFAYGPVFTFAAYVGWFVAGASACPSGSASSPPCWPRSRSACSAISSSTARSRSATRPVLVPLIASLGLYIVIENLVGIVFGTGVRVVEDLDYGIFLVGPVFFTSIHLWQVASLADHRPGARRVPAPDALRQGDPGHDGRPGDGARSSASTRSGSRCWSSPSARPSRPFRRADPAEGRRQHAYGLRRRLHGVSSRSSSAASAR